MEEPKITYFYKQINCAIELKMMCVLNISFLGYEDYSKIATTFSFCVCVRTMKDQCFGNWWAVSIGGIWLLAAAQWEEQIYPDRICCRCQRPRETNLEPHFQDPRCMNASNKAISACMYALETLFICLHYTCTWYSKSSLVIFCILVKSNPMFIFKRLQDFEIADSQNAWIIYYENFLCMVS